MRALALGAALIVLAGCTALRNPDEDATPRAEARVVLVFCILSSCHHIAQRGAPEPAPHEPQCTPPED